MASVQPARTVLSSMTVTAAVPSPKQPGLRRLSKSRGVSSSSAESSPILIPPGTAVVTYCWGPGCNGATRAALEFARLGYPVRELVGGFEYWVREGFPYDSAQGTRQLAADSLTAPVDGTVRDLRAKPGATVAKDAALLTVEPADVQEQE